MPSTLTIYITQKYWTMPIKCKESIPPLSYPELWRRSIGKSFSQGEPQHYAELLTASRRTEPTWTPTWHILE